VLDRLIDHKTQAWGVPELEYVIARNDLAGQLNAFLLSCRVDELSPATIRDYQQKIGAFVTLAQSNKITSPQKVTANHVRMFLLKLHETCKPVSISDYYRCVKRFFNWLVAEGIIERNPMASMRPPRVPKKEIEPFTPAQLRALLLLCDDNTFLGARNKAIILMFVDTGLRVSEMASIKLKDIDIRRGTIKVIGKGSKERIVRIGKRAQKILLKYLIKRNDNYSCLWVTEERRPLRAEGIQIMIRRLGKRAGLQNVRCSPHTFRHTFADQALRNGAGEFEVQSLLGHSTLTMTRKYAAKINSEYAIKGHQGTKERKGFGPVDRMGL